MKNLGFYTLCIATVSFSLFISCNKKYERPDEYSVDLFKNERNEQQKKKLSPQEAAEKSLLIIKADSLAPTDHFKINNKKLTVYTITSGKILKSTKDSIGFPMRVISDYDLKVNSSSADSTTVYLIDPISYRLLIADLKVSYQALPSAPVSE